MRMDIYPSVQGNIPQNHQNIPNNITSIPSEEQSRVIVADINQDQKVLACAGSGKTTTLIFRLKFLLDLGISPSQILITTFNVHTARNIAYLAEQILGVEQSQQLEINNIDKFALKICKKYGFKSIHKNKENSVIHQDQHQQQCYQLSDTFFSVKECCSQFLKFLMTPQGKEFTDQKNYQYIFFDEFQDINEIQYDIIMLFKQRGAYLIVFGDAAQHIYGWRDSKIEIIQTRIDEDIKQITGNTLKNFNLSTNFRSSKEIIQFGNQILKSSKEGFLGLKPMEWIEIKPELDLDASRRHPSRIHSKPKLLCFKDYHDQSEKIIQRILQLSDEFQLSFKDFAVICATNKPLQIFEETLEKHNSINTPSQRIPWVNLTDTSQNNHDFILFSRTNNLNPPDEGSLMQHCNKLTLSTIHKAKGLEWEVVFFIGLNDSNFPKSFLRESRQLAAESIQQECLRMFYVGCTRAISRLYFTVNAPTAFNCVRKICVFPKNNKLCKKLIDFLQVCRFFMKISEEFYERSDDIPFSAFYNSQTSRYYYQSKQQLQELNLKYFICLFFKKNKDNALKGFKSDLLLPDLGDIDHYESKIYHSKVQTIIRQLDYQDYPEINDLLSSVKIKVLQPLLEFPMIIKDKATQPHSINQRNEWVIKNEENSNSQNLIRPTPTSIFVHPRSVFEYQALRCANMMPGLELYIKLYTMRRIAEEFNIVNGFVSEAAHHILFTVFWSPRDYQIIQDNKTFFQGYCFEFSDELTLKNTMNNRSQEEIKIAQSTKFQEFKTSFKEFYLKQQKIEKNMKTLRNKYSSQGSVMNDAVLKRIFLRLTGILQRRNISFSSLNHRCRRTRKQECLPADYDLTQILKSYERFQDNTISTKDITNDVYRVSQCCLFTERNSYSKQGMFRNQEENLQLLQSPNFIQNIEDFLRFIRSFNSQKIELKQLAINKKQQNQYFQDDSCWCLSASVDILADRDTVYQITPSQFKSISKEQILEVLAYTSLMRKTIQIKNIVFYNPILGTIQAYYVSLWEGNTLKNQPQQFILDSESVDSNKQTTWNYQEPSRFIDLMWKKVENGTQIQGKEGTNKLSFIRNKEKKELDLTADNSQITEESQYFNSTQDSKNDSGSLQRQQFESQQDPSASQSTADSLSQLSQPQLFIVNEGSRQSEKSMNIGQIDEQSKTYDLVQNQEEHTQKNRFNVQFQRKMSMSIMENDPEIVKKRKITYNMSTNLINDQNQLDKQ